MTIKMKRTITSAFIAVFATAAMAITASAANTYKYGFSFDLDISHQQYTGACQKNNSLSYASVDVVDGQFDASDRAYFRVCENYKADDYIYDFATETKWINGPYDFTLNYYSGHGTYWKYYRLRGYNDGEMDDFEATGSWQP